MFRRMERRPGQPVALAAALACAGALLGACGQEVSFPVAALLDGARLSCAAPAYLDGEPLALSDLRLYVHDVRVLTTAGDEVPLRLQADGAFQGEGVALLDFEDGAGPCRNGTPALHTALSGTLPRALPFPAAALRLRVGVPEALNHRSPDRAAPPLDVPALQWGWTSGYTFLRLDVTLGQRPLALHLGSQGCSGLAGEDLRCKYENRAALELPLRRGAAVLELAPLVRAVARAASTSPGSSPPKKARCMGDNQDPACAGALALLGLPVVRR
jgi:uncharacterized repeat protein (TIGR04052 family)